ncbi:uncharacterized protein STEHIDRAFT_144119 [Stereum hirsutum FP-91666 SS1]|uniref:uncharacterized protein n=1 Tax=Stereum hirsutum (strain FP-91666) TaxID=721885 RepID=UPI000440B6E9|nr:uncharacterized protein STEHIDRAFT_144119 [Stereum hirsutum FP-91666 SS1]EIM92851.1 hypothetical protein STEHIDRAFT_144119 [Stereum hirsutum FP-91666 SS1]
MSHISDHHERKGTPLTYMESDEETETLRNYGPSDRILYKDRTEKERRIIRAFVRYDNDREHDSRRDLIKRYICGYGTVEKAIRNTYGDVLSEDSKYRRERFWALRNEDDMKATTKGRTVKRGREGSADSVSEIEEIIQTPRPKRTCTTQRKDEDSEPVTRATAGTNRSTRSTMRPKPQTTASTSNKIRAKSPVLPSKKTGNDAELLRFLQAAELPDKTASLLDREGISTIDDLKFIKNVKQSSREEIKKSLMAAGGFSRLQWVRFEAALDRL